MNGHKTYEVDLIGRSGHSVSPYASFSKEMNALRIWLTKLLCDAFSAFLQTEG